MFRFTIRDVLWLTVVVALLVAWWVDRRGVENRGEIRAAKIRSHAETLRTSLQMAAAAAAADVDWTLVDKPIPP